MYTDDKKVYTSDLQNYSILGIYNGEPKLSEIANIKERKRKILKLPSISSMHQL